MKFNGLFTKTPSYKRFNYTPRHYDPLEEERKERMERLQKELEAGKRTETDEELAAHQSRIKGGIQAARRRSAAKGSTLSSALLRTIITLFIVVELLAFLQFGTVALYGVLLLVPFYLFLKLRNFKRS